MRGHQHHDVVFHGTLGQSRVIPFPGFCSHSCHALRFLSTPSLELTAAAAAVFTFVNKLDRPSLEPLEILDQIEKEFNLPCYPVNWPIGSGDRFTGIYHRPTKCAIPGFAIVSPVEGIGARQGLFFRSAAAHGPAAAASRATRRTPPSCRFVIYCNAAG